MADPPSSTTTDRTATNQQPTTTDSRSNTPESSSTPDLSATTAWLSVGGRRIDLAAVLWVGGLGSLLGVGWLSAGVIGLAVGAGVAAIAYSSRPVVAVALAQAGLLVVVQEVTVGRPLAELAAFQAGLVAILLSERPVDSATVVLTVAVSAVLVAVVISAVSLGGLAAAGVAVVVLAGAMGYAVHRFERVSLGLAASTETEPGGSNG